MDKEKEIELIDAILVVLAKLRDEQSGIMREHYSRVCNSLDVLHSWLCYDKAQIEAIKKGY